MSSPLHHAKDLDDALKYAPPWARDEAQATPLVPDATKVEWPPRSRRSGAGSRTFSGDLAFLELQRQVGLQPEKVPEPVPMRGNRTAMMLALRLCAVTGVAALAAWAVVSLPSLRLARNDAGVAGSAVTAVTVGSGKQDQLTTGTAAHLLVHDGRAAANEPLPAGIELDGNRAGATIVLSGLAAETRLSAGGPLGTDGWRVDGRELEGLLIQAPRDFVGTMDVKADLRLADDHIADSQMVRLEWIRASEAPPVAAPEPAAPQPAPSQPEAVVLHLDDAEIAMLVKRGQDFLKNGDLVSARLLLQRAAAAGSAIAALALGQSFDPSVIQQLGAIGIKPDAAKAREWYQKAAQLGSNVASQQLARLAPAPE